MKRKSSKQQDLTKPEFADLLHKHCFAYLGGSVDRFVDLRHPKARRYVYPVKDKKGRMLRRDTLAALLAARAAYEAELAGEETKRQEVIALAERLAPTALPTDRASLEGPAAVHQMAEDFRTIVTRSDGVTRRDLRLVGWRDEQITAHAEAARELGYARECGVAA